MNREAHAIVRPPAVAPGDGHDVVVRESNRVLHFPTSYVLRGVTRAARRSCVATSAHAGAASANHSMVAGTTERGDAGMCWHGRSASQSLSASAARGRL